MKCLIFLASSIPLSAEDWKMRDQAQSSFGWSAYMDHLDDRPRGPAGIM